MRPDGESRQACIQQHMRTNLRTESGRYGCRSRVTCCRISISLCIRPKKQRTFGSQVPTAASGKNRNLLNIIRRADRPYPVASMAAAYAPTRAIRFRPQRAFHPRYGRCALYRVTQSTPLCIASLTFMGDLRCWSWVHSMKCSAPSLDIHCTTDPLRRSAWVVRRTRAVRSRYRSFDDLT
jgi:hypothetical protein